MAEKKEPSVKILVGYHKPAYLLKSDILVPIHLGRALATEASKDGKMSEEDYQWMLDNMIGDDTGDNISGLNRYFCEMTGIYWAWKNYDKLGNPDYIGFMHYRRHFDFTQELSSLRDGLYSEKLLNIPDEIYKILNKYDLVTPHINGFIYGKNPAESDLYINKQYQQAFDLINSLYPQYTEKLNLFLKNKKMVCGNMFIVSKNEFMAMCQWLFSILFPLHKQIDYTQLSVAASRACGYIAEYLTSFYWFHLSGIKNIANISVSHRELPIKIEIFPAFEKNNIPVVFSSDDNYAPYLGVALKSLIENCSEKNNYDIIILNRNISLRNKKFILKLTDKPNIKIRFFNISLFITDDFFVHNYFSEETYYRLYLPTIMKNYDKAVYLDCDISVNEDIANLYNIDIKNNWIGATYNISTMPCIIENAILYQRNWPDYIINELGVKNPFHYFQAGVLIFNFKELRKYDVQQQFLKELKRIEHPLVDQDILNKVCYGHVHHIHQSWDFEWIPPQNLVWIPKEIYSEFLEALNNKKIIHYDGEKKVWKYPHLEDNISWWKYARMTPFYEEILYKNLKLQIPDFDGNTAKEILNYSKNKFRYWRYKLLSKITFGNMRKHYKRKKKDLKKRLKQVRKFLKG